MAAGTLQHDYGAGPGGGVKAPEKQGSSFFQRQAELREAQLRITFAPSLIALAVVLAGFLFGLSNFARYADDPAEQIAQYYQWVSHTR